MDRTYTLASVGSALATVNLGIAAMWGEGVIQMAGASQPQLLTAWYLLAFMGVYQLYRLGRSRGVDG